MLAVRRKAMRREPRPARRRSPPKHSREETNQALAVGKGMWREVN
jgi:hypothetical protein